MKKISLVIIVSIALVGSYCNKTDSNKDVHCEGLITDTTGTGDNAKLYMPNAFTPNGDGINDIAVPYTQSIVNTVFTIYDENNNVVFSTSILGEGWKPVTNTNTSHKYYYKIQATTVNSHKIGKCGELYLLTCFPSSISRSYFYFTNQLTTIGFTGVQQEILSNCP